VTPDQEARWDNAEAAADYAAMAELDMELWAPLGTAEALHAMFIENARASNSDDPAVEPEAASRLGENEGGSQHRANAGNADRPFAGAFQVVE
jgi:hypothetical protein